MNDQPLVEKKQISDVFRRMAEDIDHNSTRTFGGACVIYPPGGGELIEFLTVGTADLAQFYGTIQTRLTIQLAQLKAQEGQAFRHQR